MTADQETPRVVTASREVAAGPDRIFGLIADRRSRARATTAGRLRASLDRLAVLAEGS
jgi:hypothetical protein